MTDMIVVTVRGCMNYHSMGKNTILLHMETLSQVKYTVVKGSRLFYQNSINHKVNM